MEDPFICIATHDRRLFVCDVCMKFHTDVNVEAEYRCEECKEVAYCNAECKEKVIIPIKLFSSR